MTLDNRIEAFSTLGKFLKQVAQDEPITSQSALNELYYNDFKALIAQVAIYNPWFTEQNIQKAIAAIAENLDKNSLQTFIAPYREGILKNKKAQQVAVIMAGNIPMVGFYDFFFWLFFRPPFFGKISFSDKNL